MKTFLLAAFFATMVMAHFMNLNFSVLPGLSVKNAVLYLLVLIIAFEISNDARRGGIYQRAIPYFALHGAYVLIFFLAVLSILICLFVLDYPGYTPAYAISTLKGYIVDHYLIFVVFLAGTSTRESAERLLRGMLLFLAAGCLVALVDLFDILDLGVMVTRRDGRLQGVLGSNEYGALMAFFVPISVALLFATKGWSRATWLLVTVAFLMILVFTTSRGAVVGLIGGTVLAIALLRQHINSARAIKVAVVMLVFAAATVSVLLVQHEELLHTRFVELNRSQTAFDLTSGRTEIWGNALAMMAGQPVSFLTGFGWKTFELMNPIASHNEFLEALFELGVLGLLLMLFVKGVVAYHLVGAVNSARASQRPLFIGITVGYLSVLISINFSALHEVANYVWAVSGLALRMGMMDAELLESHDPDSREIGRNRGDAVGQRAVASVRSRRDVAEK